MQETMQETVLKMDGVRKNYGTFALDCTLSVMPGRIVGLIGQNGAGKSTAFKAALNLISIDGGSIELLGKEHTRLTAEDRRKIGVVLSGSGFSEYLNVRDITSILDKFYPAFDAAGFLALCKRFGLQERKKLKEFSTGMQAKLKLLVALSHGADFLILDEPTSGLDVVAREELLGLLQDYLMEDEGRAVLLSSHISGDLEKFCDEIYMIHEGSVVLHEETDVLLGNYGVIKADGKQAASLDPAHLLRGRREGYGYRFLTDQRQFYMENYPGLAVEKGNIDDIIFLMAKGEKTEGGIAL